MLTVVTEYSSYMYTDKTYQTLSVLESCQDALNEGIDDTRVIDMTLSYTYSYTMEILENIKEMLLKLCSTILSILNNFILNHAKYLSKYRELLKERLSKLKEPFIFERPEYQFKKDFPKVIKASSEIETDIKRLQDHIRDENWDQYKVTVAVDHMIESFSKKVLGQTVDPDDITDTTIKIVTKEISGKSVISGLDEATIDQFIDEINDYKLHVSDVKKTKTDIIAEYKALRSIYERAIIPPTEIKHIDRMKSIYDPEWYQFAVREKNRFASINTEMSRMFNGFIKIYEVSFNTKLNLLTQRLNSNRQIIHELLLRTGLTAALQTKQLDRNTKPFKPDPTIIT